MRLLTSILYLTMVDDTSRTVAIVVAVALVLVAMAAAVIIIGILVQWCRQRKRSTFGQLNNVM